MKSVSFTARMQKFYDAEAKLNLAYDRYNKATSKEEKQIFWKEVEKLEKEANRQWCLLSDKDRLKSLEQLADSLENINNQINNSNIQLDESIKKLELSVMRMEEAIAKSKIK